MYDVYRDEIYSLQNLLSRTQAGPGRTVKKEQEEISPNHVRRINLISVRIVFTEGLKYRSRSDVADYVSIWACIHVIWWENVENMAVNDGSSSSPSLLDC